MSRPLNSFSSHAPNALHTLHASLQNTPVLSVYVDGSAEDPAVRRTWRQSLDRELNAIDARLRDAPKRERESFDECRRVLGELIDDGDPIGEAPAWNAFITADGAHIAQTLAARAPTYVAWRSGPAIAPLTHALSRSPHVVAVIVDARHSIIHSFQDGRLQRVETVQAHHPSEHPEHMGGPPRAGFHTGTRGRTGRDAAQRTYRNGRNRMLDETVARVARLAGDDSWVVIGGIERVASQLFDKASALWPERVSRVEGINFHSAEPEIATAAYAGAEVLREAQDVRRLAAAAEQAGSGGLAVVGVKHTRAALDQRCVRELYVTERYLEENPGAANDAVDAVLSQDGTVREVVGRAAAALDGVGGIAAALRFRPPTLTTVVVRNANTLISV